MRMSVSGWSKVAMAVGALSLGIGVVPARADTSDQARLLSLTNQVRSSNGLPALSIDGQLNSVAQSWADTLAQRGVISHNSSLPDQVTGWTTLGENVGVGGIRRRRAPGLHGQPHPPREPRRPVVQPGRVRDRAPRRPDLHRAGVHAVGLLDGPAGDRHLVGGAHCAPLRLPPCLWSRPSSPRSSLWLRGPPAPFRRASRQPPALPPISSRSGWCTALTSSGRWSRSRPSRARSTRAGGPVSLAGPFQGPS